MESFSESSVPRSIESGTKLRDRYRIERLLGEGGFAKTYLAFDRERNNQCVIKALSLRSAIPDSQTEAPRAFLRFC
jgi:serine/threonine protein kinase